MSVFQVGTFLDNLLNLERVVLFFISSGKPIPFFDARDMEGGQSDICSCKRLMN